MLLLSGKKIDANGLKQVAVNIVRSSVFLGSTSFLYMKFLQLNTVMHILETHEYINISFQKHEYHLIIM